MKITKVEVFRLPTANSKQNSPIGCRIHTDVGICGDGEAGMAYGVGGSGAFGMVCDLAELIIGMDPLRTEFIWETMYKRTFWGQNGGPVVFSGIAAIDVALWDIKGKYRPCRNRALTPGQTKNHFIRQRLDGIGSSDRTP